MGVERDPTRSAPRRGQTDKALRGDSDRVKEMTWGLWDPGGLKR